MKLPVLIGCLLLAVGGCQYVPKQNYPRADECGGVPAATLRAAYDAALAHVERKGYSKADFHARIRNCPRWDLVYFQNVPQQ